MLGKEVIKQSYQEVAGKNSKLIFLMMPLAKGCTR